MSESQIIPIRSQPGIKRDGTIFEGDAHVDGRWVRWQRGLARKIGGYRSINKYLFGLPRSLHAFAQDEYTYVHAGSSARIDRFFVDSTYNVSVVNDRTPAALTSNSNNLWQFDTDTSVVTTGTQLLAHVAPNMDITSSTDGQLFYGSVTGTAALTQTTVFPTDRNLAGGVVALHPYTVLYGADGCVMWSEDFTDFTVAGAGSAFVTGQKIVKGLPMRGGPGSSPSGLLWSLDSLVRMTYVGGTETFQFDHLATETSILSSQSVIDYDGVFYWLATDRFMMFNGVVQEVPNLMNRDFFFDNVNLAYRQKVFAFKVPRYGEIWWCFPYGDSTEPNWAIIYNVRENTWYDTPLPEEDGRGAGLFAPILGKPLISGTEAQGYTASAVAVAAGGAGYTVGDVLTVTGGSHTVATQVTVDTVAAGVVTAVSVATAGSYASTPSNPASTTGGTGTGATLTLTYVQSYKLWIHEVGVNAVDGADEDPIESYFETSDMGYPTASGITNWMRVDRIEPDFVQVGDMTVQVKGRANARAPEVDGEPHTFSDTATSPDEQVVNLKEQRRQLRFRFSSNTLNGDYQQGTILGHFRPGDDRVTA